MKRNWILMSHSERKDKDDSQVSGLYNWLVMSFAEANKNWREDSLTPAAYT